VIVIMKSSHAASLSFGSHVFVHFLTPITLLHTCYNYTSVIIMLCMFFELLYLLYNHPCHPQPYLCCWPYSLSLITLRLHFGWAIDKYL
jgi:hypothetical protein